MLADSTSLHVRQQTSRSQSDPACSTRETLQANVPLKVLCSRQSHPTLYSSWHRMHWYLCELFWFLKPPHPPHLILIHGQKKIDCARQHGPINTYVQVGAVKQARMRSLHPRLQSPRATTNNNNNCCCAAAAADTTIAVPNTTCSKAMQRAIRGLYARR